MGLLSYDHFDPKSRAGGLPCRVFDVTEALVWNRSTQQMVRRRSLLRNGRSWMTGTIKGTHDLIAGTHDWTKIASAALADDAPKWEPQSSPQSYQKFVEGAIRDIRDGRYYQVNLLKFFSAPDADFSGIAARISAWGGAMSSAWRVSGLDMVSLSPERFVRVLPDRGGLSIETRPIKGTIERGRTPVEDQTHASHLMNSTKERAELAMIIDLMRNDLNRVCASGSVEVISHGHLESLPYAHHRVGVVRGLLRQLTLGEFFETLLPGGSITGAPKVAAMQAIKSYEGRTRGYFMGAAFFWDPVCGYLDSSLLIRTAYRLVGEQSGAGPFEFAAGSGIVLDSDPAAEEREVMLKARCVDSSGRP